MTGETIFRNARPDEKDRILALYSSVKGRPYCFWDEDYPSDIEADRDLQHGCLYVLEDGEDIIGAISAEAENELDDLPCWELRHAVGEVARVVIAPAWQGKGLSEKLVALMEQTMKEQSYLGVHLLVAMRNDPALACYRRLGYRFFTPVEMYGIDFFPCEKKL